MRIDLQADGPISPFDQRCTESAGLSRTRGRREKFWHILQQALCPLTISILFKLPSERVGRRKSYKVFSSSITVDAEHAVTYHLQARLQIGNAFFQRQCQITIWKASSNTRSDTAWPWNEQRAGIFRGGRGSYQDVQQRYLGSPVALKGTLLRTML